MDKKELENFLYYILDKVEDCYQKEVKTAINDFLKETSKKKISNNIKNK